MQPLSRQTRRRVMIADDDPVIRRWLASLLESEGYAVVLMDDGRAAFRALQTDADFAGAVFDMSMPYLQGPDLIRYMRTEKRLMKIPVLMITAETAISAVSTCLTAGATIVLPKPFTRQRLQHTLRMILGDSPRGAQRSVESHLPNGQRADSSQPIVDRDEHEACVADRAVDLSILNALDNPQDGKDGLVVELIDLYLENAAGQISEIKSAVEANKPQRLNQTAHALKGSSLTIGARDVGNICERIEHEQIGSTALAELLAKLDLAFASTSEALQVARRTRLVPVAA